MSNLKNKLKMVKISDITPYKNNAKKHSDNQIQDIKKSIEKYDYYSPIGIDEKNEIVIGHGRYMAMIEIDPNQKIEVVDFSYLTPKEIKKLRILDNKIVSNEWDLDILQSEIDDIFNGYDNPDEIINELSLSHEDLIIPEFEAGNIDEQGQLDQLQPKIVKCPECGHEHDARKTEVKA